MSVLSSTLGTYNREVLLCFVLADRVNARLASTSKDFTPAPAPTYETAPVADLLFILSAAKVTITYLVHNLQR